MPQCLRKRLQIIFFGDINLYVKKLKFRGGIFKMKLKKLVSFVSAVTMTAVCLAGCGSTAGSSSSQGSVLESVSASASAETSSDTESTDAVNVSLLKGPTGMGAVMLMKDQEEGQSEGNYNFTIESAADDVVSKVINGETDIAAVPSNAAAALYNKTEGNIEIAAVNAMGMLYYLQTGDDVNSVTDLAGKTITSSGQGAVPEYVLNYILEKSGTENVTVNYMQTHQELATAAAAGEVDDVILPEPFVEIALAKNPNLRVALDISKCYDEYTTGVEEKEDMPNSLPMGALIVRKDFAESNPQAVDTFLKEYEKSVAEVNSDPQTAAEYVVKYGILDSQPIAEKAIPKSSIYYIDGEEMKNIMTNFLDVMNNANPKSIGGKMPDDNFYYTK